MTLSRRSFLAHLPLAIAAGLIGSRLPSGLRANEGGRSYPQPFSIGELPYEQNALEPFIDQLTMKIHHQRHHAAYVNNLNRAIERFPEIAEMDLVALMKNISAYDSGVRNNGGGHYNHDLFWQVMSPAGEGGEPSGELMDAIDRAFGDMETLRETFNQAALARFGSGWAWLIVRPDGTLAVTSTPNQDNPLMDLIPEDEKGTPVLGVDVWEHAYYLSYQNRRGDYLKQWWRVVNWTDVNRRFAEA